MLCAYVYVCSFFFLFHRLTFRWNETDSVDKHYCETTTGALRLYCIAIAIVPSEMNTVFGIWFCSCVFVLLLLCSVRIFSIRNGYILHFFFGTKNSLRWLHCIYVQYIWWVRNDYYRERHSHLHTHAHSFAHTLTLLHLCV